MADQQTYRGWVIVYDKKPIPVRTMDWGAYDDDEPEAPMVFGKDIDDLKSQIDEEIMFREDSIESWN